MVTVPEPGESPEYPTKDVVKDDDPALVQARYQADVSGWIEHYKTQTTAAATALALDEARKDTATALAAARADTDATNEAALLKSIHDAYVETTQKSLDRAITRATVVTTATGSITTIYTGLLALVYSLDTTKGKALSLVALFPALFLGAALVLVAIYAALIKRTTAVGPFLPSGIGGQVAELRLVTFMRWCFAGVLARSWALHAGIASLGVGLAFLPLPFVRLAGWIQLLLFLAGVAAVAAAGAVEYLQSKQA